MEYKWVNGIYTRLNDLANNESDDFTWYYAAGDVASIANEVNQVAEDTVTAPTAVEISRNDDTLTAQLKNGDGSDYTTSAAVTYDWYRDGQSVQSGTDNTYSIGNADEDTNITVQVDQYILESNPIYIPGNTKVTTPPAVVVTPDDPESDTKTPSAITIKGTERVGKTLEAMLLTKSGAQFTTSAGVTYEWYRLSSKDSSSQASLGNEETYKLVSDDKGKYIKVIANYNGYTFEYITGKIAKKSLSRSSSSSSSSEDQNDKSNSNSNKQPENIVPPAKTGNGWEKQSDNTWKYGENGQAVTGWKKLN